MKDGLVSTVPGNRWRRALAATPGRLQMLPLLLLTGAAAWWALPYAALQLRADFTTLETRAQVMACHPSAAAAWPESQWRRLQEDLQRGISINPADPVLRDAMAQLHACHGFALWDHEPSRKYWFSAALTAYEASLALRPDNAPALVGRAAALSASDAPANEINAAWLRALKFGPMEGPVKAALADLALRHWATAEPEMKRWLRQQLDDAPPDRKRQLLTKAAQLGVADLTERAAARP
jgi:hypothetical protein